jgi:hypothetical protein
MMLWKPILVGFSYCLALVTMMRKIAVNRRVSCNLMLFSTVCLTGLIHARVTVCG